VDIDDEDSLTERFGRSSQRGLIDIAVIRLPRISNFTDFSPFERFPNVSLRYVANPQDLHEPDMIILPGTKSTMADLLWMRESGMETMVKKAADKGTLIFGICGGYQMLGRSIRDPQQVEAAGVTSLQGMGLLPMDTLFEGEKVQTQTQGIFRDITGELKDLNGLSYRGYEIHMGRSRAEEGTQRPAVMCSGNIYGSYIHGIFDADQVAASILKVLCRRKGISPDMLLQSDMETYKQSQYDKLADAVRQGLDMEFVYSILH